MTNYELQIEEFEFKTIPFRYLYNIFLIFNWKFY